MKMCLKEGVTGAALQFKVSLLKESVEEFILNVYFLWFRRKFVVSDDFGEHSQKCPTVVSPKTCIKITVGVPLLYWYTQFPLRPRKNAHFIY